jgi:hypothetical protein
MSTSENLVPARSANIGDCVRLWSTLTGEYIPALRLELEFLESEHGHTGIRVMVCDYSTLTNPPEIHKSIWAIREFYNPLHLISISQLFDLLIVAYRTIDEYFVNGKDNRPRPAKG